MITTSNTNMPAYMDCLARVVTLVLGCRAPGKGGALVLGCRAPGKGGALVLGCRAPGKGGNACVGVQGSWRAYKLECSGQSMRDCFPTARSCTVTPDCSWSVG